MMRLPLAWTLFTFTLWTTGSNQILTQGSVKKIYPTISSNETIECDCSDNICDTVYWFRSMLSDRNVQYLGKCNNANRVTYGNAMKNRIAMSKKGNSFVLRMAFLQENDKGIYSCVLTKGKLEIPKTVALLLPRVNPTTPPKPKPKLPPKIPACNCRKKDMSQGDCDSLVWWPLVGLTAGLALAVICTLYYFSRLPKKCHHHFSRKRHMP